MNLKPFSLEEAKAGKPIVFADGSPAKFIAHLPEAKAGYELIVFDPRECRCRALGLDGVGIQLISSDHARVFMAPICVTVWVNIYSERFNKYHDGVPSGVWESRAIADSAAADGKRIACVPVTYTEGEGI